MNSIFYMVLRNNGFGSASTSRRHSTFDNAAEEAHRLSKEHGGEFIIMKSTHRMNARPAWVRDVEPIGGDLDDDMPF
ncbi:MAG: hypothetical protein JKY96_01490 [Phycisphaerales bacterium]|nr:hypothetical protein [Phycisphaerales bacterium]